jgi:disulfide bond formation protein DsbB
MTSTPPAYHNMISPRSRRLRSIGLMLMIAALTMGIYGYFVLMPSLQRSVPTAHATTPTVSAPQSPAQAGNDADRQLRRERRVATAKVLFAYGYWSVCGLLALGVMFTAWLDTREVSRNYLKERRSVWLDAARNIPNDRED